MQTGSAPRLPDCQAGPVLPGLLGAKALLSLKLAAYLKYGRPG